MGQVITSFVMQPMLACCGSLITFLLFGFIVFLRHFPQIISGIQKILRGIVDVSLLCYQTILRKIFPSFIENTVFRFLFSILFSILVCSAITYLVARKLVLWPIAIALLHGIIVGVIWEVNANSDHLYLGKNL